MSKLAHLLGCQTFGDLVRDSIIAVGLSIASLFCSTVYILGPVLAVMIQGDLTISDQHLNVINGVALIGLQFSLFAGLVVDKFGARVTVVVGLLMTVFSWVGVGFLPQGDSSWVGVLLLLVVNSFGEGFTFLAAFKTSMQMNETGGGIPLGLVSMCMSLSLSVATGSINVFNAYCPKTDNACWRSYTKMFAVQAAVAHSIAFFALFLFKEKNYPWLLQQDQIQSVSPDDTKPLVNGIEGEEAVDEGNALLDEPRDSGIPMTETGPDEKVTALQTFRIWLHPYFLVMFFAYFATMGSSVGVLATIHNVWSDYIDHPSLCPVLSNTTTLAQCQYYGGMETVGTAFSYSSAAAGVISAVLTNFLVRRRIISARRMYQMTIVSQTLCYVVMGTLYVVSTRTYSTLALFAFCLAFMGFNFGCALNFAAITFGDLFGYSNFGTYYSFMQLSGSAASATGALIAGSLFARFDNYVFYLYGWATLLVISFILIAVVPITPFKRKSS